MNKLYNLFNDKEQSFKNELPELLGNVDKKSVGYFKSQNLDRSNFNYKILSNIGWWPDEIVTFLEIIRISYTEFINTYSAIANVYDIPIRNAILFMSRKKYNKLSDIVKYYNNCKDDNYGIPDNYLNAVISEDNCYMYEIEERSRSKNEQKHYLLVKALTKLMELTPIKDNDFELNKEYEKYIKTYLCIYHLKNAYAVVDDTLRNIIKATFEGNSLDINLPFYFNDMLEDLNGKVGKYIKDINDEVLFEKSMKFKDLILYALYSTTQFDYVFNFKRDLSISDKKDIYLISPFVSTPEKNRNMRTIDAANIFTNDVIIRIQHIFKYYLSILISNYNKSKLLKETNNFDLIIDTLEKNSFNQRPVTPTYVGEIIVSNEDNKRGMGNDISTYRERRKSKPHVSFSIINNE